MRLQEAASWRLDEIYRYTQTRWGEQKARDYINGLFESFEQIASRRTKSIPIPAEFEVQGFYFRFERHIVYWKWLSDGDIGIVTILHERMHQIERFREDFFGIQ